MKYSLVEQIGPADHHLPWVVATAGLFISDQDQPHTYQKKTMDPRTHNPGFKQSQRPLLFAIVGFVTLLLVWRSFGSGVEDVPFVTTVSIQLQSADSGGPIVTTPFR